MAAQQVISDIIKQSYVSVVNCVVGFKNETHLSLDEEKVFTDLVRTLAEVALPYLLRCASHIFHSPAPLFDLSTITGKLSTFYEHSGDEPGGNLTTTDVDTDTDTEGASLRRKLPQRRIRSINHGSDDDEIDDEEADELDEGLEDEGL